MEPTWARGLPSASIPTATGCRGGPDETVADASPSRASQRSAVVDQVTVVFAVGDLQSDALSLACVRSTLLTKRATAHSCCWPLQYLLETPRRRHKQGR